jgi:long-subunit acyl-CoA synthetase (AMP-forming)
MSSLSALLARRARADGGRVALAFKERGTWQAFTWQEVERQVWSLASALTRHGFGADSRLLVTGQGSAHQVCAVLAALSLGGSVASVDDLSRPPGSAVVAASDLVLDETPAVASTPQKRAHERWILELDLSVQAAAVSLLGSWLDQGFELGIPEEAPSVERDARELGISARVTTPAAWDTWAETVRGRFPAQGSLQRRLVEWALRSNGNASAVSGWPRWFAAVLIIRPLRRALGVSRWQRAVSWGGAPQPTTTLLLAGLGVRRDELMNPDQQTALDAPIAVTRPPIETSAAGELVRQSA